VILFDIGLFGACFDPNSNGSQVLPPPLESRISPGFHYAKVTADITYMKQNFQVICSRPGRRMWLADTSGKVLATLKPNLPAASEFAPYS
jgi:hypothetical protein